MGHLATLATGAVAVIPLEFLGLGGVKNLAFKLCMWITVMTLMFTLKANYGAPPMPSNISWSNWKEVGMTALQPWLQKVMTSPDFPMLFFAVIFLTAYQSLLPLLILG